MKKRLWYAGIGAALSLLFLIFSILVSKDIFTKMDFDTTVKIQNKIPHRFDDPFSFLSLVGSFEVVVGLLIIFFVVNAFITKKWYRILLFAFFILFHVVEVIGKTALDHVGPPFMFHRNTSSVIFPSGYVSTDYYSYPSGHMGRTLFLVGILGILIYQQKWELQKKIIGWAILLGVIFVMEVSRIYLGEHWLSDTIGGALLGLSFAFFTMVFW